jgi:site-specific recombinase XerD
MPNTPTPFVRHGTGIRLTRPIPLSRLGTMAVPDVLSGARGAHRHPGGVEPGLVISNDLELIESWLQATSDNANTRSAYQREVERLLLWAWTHGGKALSALNQKDLAAYATFLSDPAPADFWCGPQKPASDAGWRPFAGGLSRASRVQAMVIIRGFFRYAQACRYLSADPTRHLPATLFRLPRGHQNIARRYLPEPAMQWLGGWLNNLCNTATCQRHRLRLMRLALICDALYLTAARVSDLSRARLGQLEQQTSSQWIWHLPPGKGQVVASLPVDPRLITRIGMYRQAAGWHESPGQWPDEAAWIPGYRGQQPLSPRTIQYELNWLGQQACKAARAEGLPFASKFSELTPHWFRHSSLTQLVKSGANIGAVQKFARHASLNTTQKYLHMDNQFLAREIVGKL